MVDFRDLTRPCDACGQMIGGGSYQCKKCNIVFCLYCSIKLMYFKNDFPIKCPMCEKDFE